jgi:hypothetical protein
MLQRVSLFIFFIFLLNTILYAQKLEVELKNYTRKDGLPSNETYYVLRDSKNYLWIATDQGVVRYDGKEMKKFELQDNVIFKIKEDEKGRIWFFSSSGKLSYCANGIIYNYKYSNAILKETKNLTITDANVFNDRILINSSHDFNLKISKDGHIYSYKYGNYNKTNSLLIEIKKQDKVLFAQKLHSFDTIHKFLDIKFSGSNTISYKIPFNQKSFDHYGVIANEENLYFFNSNLIIKLFPDGTCIVKKMPSNILGISFGCQNNIWVSLLNNGAISLTKELDEIEHILSKYTVTSSMSDYEGGTWFSTLEKGVFYLKNEVNKKYDTNLGSNQQTFRISTITNTNFLFATRDGIFWSTPNKIDLIFNLKLRLVSDLLLYDNKIILVGALEKPSKTLKNVYGNKFSTNNQLYKRIDFIAAASEVFELSKNNFFVGHGPMYNEIDLNTSSESDLSKIPLFYHKSILLQSGKLFSDNKNQFWLGTINSLLKFNISLDSLETFNENEPLFKKGVTNLVQMDNDLYALGIRFGGLAIMKDSTVIENITELNGLSSNSVKYILPHKNYLWVATVKGISIVYFTSFSPLKYKVINVASGKDFADITVNHLTYLGKDVLAATNNGIYRFNDSLIIAESNTVKPLPFYINTISYNNIDTAGITSISVPYNSARISIGFSAISFANGDDIQYRYRISNNDTTWSYIKNTELLLENLSPGNYKVQLQALIKYQDRYSEIRELNITVEKPWWQNNWFRLLVGILVLLGGYLFYQNRIKKINAAATKELETKSKFLELEQTALRSQMNPHFVFNCLSSIQQLILSGDTESANNYLVQFSRLMRQTLELSATPYNTIDEEERYITDYILLEQLRFSNRFNFVFNISTNIEKYNFSIPNMMIQPIVENAINHGLKNLKIREGLVTINISLQKDILICSVKDNGNGRSFNTNKEYEKHKSFGMEIITKRLATFNNNESCYKIEVVDLKKDDNTASLGTEVILYLPIKRIK